MRLQKFLAEAGAASRRQGENLIREGRVTVNEMVVTALGSCIEPERDRVTLDGRVLRARRRLYVAIHKPPGYVCTRRDPHARRIITDLLPPEWRALYPVGRLDQASEGLLFLTNDGDFCLRLTHPRYGVRKTYQVTTQGRLTPDLTRRLTRGVRDRGDFLRATRARLLRAGPTRGLVELDLNEGKYREVRRLLAALGLVVLRLCRTQIGPIKLGDLPPGKWRVLSPVEIRTLTNRGRTTNIDIQPDKTST